MTRNNHTCTPMGGAIKSQRSSNLELYRIIVMFLIVCHHYVVNSGLMEVLHEDPTSARSLFYYIFGAWGKTGINCFVLITGYFMCKSNITLRKFLKLILQVYFYDIVINGIFAVSGYHHHEVKEALLLLWPVKGINGNFTSCFLVFFLCIPFLNILIRNITLRQHQLLIALLLFSFSIVDFPPLAFDVTFNYVTWFCILYLISSYLRLYPLKQDKNITLWAALTIGSIFIGITSILYLVSKGIKFPYHYISDSNQIISLAIAISSFMLFKNLRIPQSKVINMIASTTFGILLIHANNDSMRQWLWKDMVDCVGHYASPLWYAPLVVLGVFLVCSLFDLIRHETVESLLIDFTEKIITNIYGRRKP